MDEQTGTKKLCRFCGFEREINNYHRLYDACKKCASIRYAKLYQKNGEKKLKNLNNIAKIIKINFNETGKLLTHTKKLYVNL